MGRRKKPVAPMAVVKFLKEIGQKGGQARAKALSSTERKSVAARGGQSRWSGLTADQRKRLMAKVRAKRKKS